MDLDALHSHELRRSTSSWARARPTAKSRTRRPYGCSTRYWTRPCRTANRLRTKIESRSRSVRRFPVRPRTHSAPSHSHRLYPRPTQRSPTQDARSLSAHISPCIITLFPLSAICTTIPQSAVPCTTNLSSSVSLLFTTSCITFTFPPSVSFLR